ncbi:unnamed protein product [Bursaphelenchus xylophilus]|uniref:Major sperm protein n=1 Tax=Bursaphelenchus xylophilus TaxID=6326 RepID=A0A1I7SD27_BURXY|nr:unnamed protein product [Bursaphelenchus xylophilus]CAG9093046.1 unnamed protein product [Bursaphelenchus xylophilus]
MPNEVKMKPKAVENKRKPRGMVGAPRSYIKSMQQDLNYSIQVKPTQIVFDPRQFFVTLFIINTCAKQLCFKIRPPSSKIFTVTPLSGFIKPFEKAYVVIHRPKPIAHNDSLLIEFGPDTGVEHAAVLFDDKWVDSETLSVPVFSKGPGGT